MVQCAALNCTVKSGQGLSLYLFPKDVKLRKIWVLKLKRDGFEPSQYTKLCEHHFEKDQFAVNPDVAATVGFQPKSKMLITGAIPTRFDYHDPKIRLGQHGKRPAGNPPPTQCTPRTSTALEKRRRIQVLDDLMESGSSTTGTDPTDEIREQPVAEQNPVDQKELCSRTIQTTYDLVKRRHAKIQTNIELPPPPPVKMVTVSTQTEQTCIEHELNTSFLSVDDNHNDPDWSPDNEIRDEPSQECQDINPSKERKFIVFESCLDQLFQSCQKCGSPCSVTKHLVATYVQINSLCDNCCNTRKWESQPKTNTMPLGNLIMAGAVLFSGSSASKFITLCRHASLQMFSIGTYMNIQSLYLVPTIEDVWQCQQCDLFSTARATGEPLRLGGDGRCCSPGHTAKYLSYTLMDLRTNKILDTQLVQKNEVKNSYAMELEGLKRSLERITDEKLEISHLVTDRHSQIKKYMNDTHPNITHWFDCWHIAKGVFKKLEALGKAKKSEVVGQWARSISNHIYWCAMSSDGNGELVYEKWTSILNHVCNIHEGHGQQFQICEHGDLEDRAWIKKGSRAYDELEKVVKGRLLLKDIKRISPAEQTSGLEAFHKVLCHFAPKLVHYFHAQMEARLQLAALHFNENASRQQATNQQGDAIYSVSFPKGRKGEGVAKEVKVKQTFNYIDELFEDLINRRETNITFAEARHANDIEGKDRPLPLAQSTPRPNKIDIVEAHRSRFN